MKSRFVVYCACIVLVACSPKPIAAKPKTFVVRVPEAKIAYSVAGDWGRGKAEKGVCEPFMVGANGNSFIQVTNPPNVTGKPYSPEDLSTFATGYVSRIEKEKWASDCHVGRFTSEENVLGFKIQYHYHKTPETTWAADGINTCYLVLNSDGGYVVVNYTASLENFSADVEASIEKTIARWNG